MPKILVIGHARHGKDSVCRILQQKYNLSFMSSSQFVAEKAVRPWMEKLGIVYPDFETMYADRVNHRSTWFDAIAAYNENDPARLGKELFAEYDIYCGLRNKKEFEALYKDKAFDVSFWVDASCRVPDEDTSSMTLNYWDADYIINNNGPEMQLEQEVIITMERAANDGLISL